MNDNDFNRVNASGEVSKSIWARGRDSFVGLAGTLLGGLQKTRAFITRPITGQPQIAKAMDMPGGSDALRLIQ